MKVRKVFINSPFQGLAGGKIIVYPSSNHPSNFKAEENIIVGNVCFYGATAGKVKVILTCGYSIYLSSSNVL